MLSSLLATATAHPGFYRRTHTYLDQDQVMAYDPAAGSYSVLQMIRGSARRSGCQTFNPMPLRRGELPAFRKHGGFTAFVEGWGLYSERLAEEMGLYADTLDRIGVASFDAWRGRSSG